MNWFKKQNPSKDQIKELNSQRQTSGYRRSFQNNRRYSQLEPWRVLLAISKIINALTFFLNEGRPVKVPGPGIFSPVSPLDGTVKLNLRVDKKLAAQLNKNKKVSSPKIRVRYFDYHLSI